MSGGGTQGKRPRKTNVLRPSRESVREASAANSVIPCSSCSFVAVILPPLKEPGGDQFVQQTFTEGSLQTEQAARLWQGERQARHVAELTGDAAPQLIA